MTKRLMIAVTLAVASFSALANEPVTVQPEKITNVVMSNKDLNRVVCTNGGAVDFLVSEEKPINVGYTSDGKAFTVKFSVNTNTVTGERRYVTTPVEAVFVCGSESFEMIIEPKMVDMRKIKLGSESQADSIKENMALFRGMEMEDAAQLLSTQIILESANNPLPYSYTIKPAPKDLSSTWFNLVDGIVLRPIRDVKVDGVGLRATEYQMLAKRNVSLNETDFLITPLGENIISITTDLDANYKNLYMKRGQQATLIIGHLENY
ncbi:TraK domain-containing protein [Vibrio harveyi]|uniref:TraK domain-containing protein n=1 Tax=Vibrio harveyi TaxID=669 RepID=UPI003BB6C0A7